MYFLRYRRDILLTLHLQKLLTAQLTRHDKIKGRLESKKQQVRNI